MPAALRHKRPEIDLLVEPLAPVLTIKLNVFAGNGTAKPFGRHVLIIWDARGFSCYCIKLKRVV